MTFTELLKDFIDTSKERLKTPISGAFLWSFFIFNWRPVFLLLFSNAQIEDKIIVINHEYCTFWSIFWPVVFATLYTLLMPKITLLIDKDLASTQEERITKQYEAIRHEVRQKTGVAKEEFLLKSEESGNQTIQELNSQIDALKDTNNGLQESIKQINDSNKVTVDELNKLLVIAKEVASEKDLQITRLTRLNNLKKDSPKEIHIQDDSLTDYRKMVLKYLDKSNIGADLFNTTREILSSLIISDFKAIEMLTLTKDKEILLSHSSEITVLEALVTKSVLRRNLTVDKLVYTLTESGIILYNSVKVRSKK